MLEIFKLRAENNRLKEEIAQKDMTIQYLNGCINKANRRSLDLLSKILNMSSGKDLDFLDFPNSSVEADRQISIHDILEN